MSGPNPPIYNSVVRDLGINPFIPLERYKAYDTLKHLSINVNRMVVVYRHEKMLQKLINTFKKLGFW